MNPRYAIYYAPALPSLWWAFGDSWLRSPEFDEVTAEPRRYGFHATLKAPFRLADGATPQDLVARVQQLACALRPVPLAALVPVYMDGFVALVPARANPATGVLAQACVDGLDDLRAPLSQAEVARRNPAVLDARGRELLERFGYPHVLERFRFHMTLSGPVDMAMAGRIVAQLARPVAQLHHEEPPVLDRLCIFTEPEPGAAFERMADLELR